MLPLTGIASARLRPTQRNCEDALVTSHLLEPHAPRAFHVMSKPTGAICNLDCEYCFFLSKEQLYPGSTFRMDAGVHRAYIKQLLTGHAGISEVVVAFQGASRP